MLRTEAIICFILFPTNFPIVLMAAISYSHPILLKFNSNSELIKKCYFQALVHSMN